MKEMNQDLDQGLTKILILWRYYDEPNLNLRQFMFRKIKDLSKFTEGGRGSPSEFFIKIEYRGKEGGVC